MSTIHGSYSYHFTHHTVCGSLAEGKLTCSFVTPLEASEGLGFEFFSITRDALDNLPPTLEPSETSCGHVLGAV